MSWTTVSVSVNHYYLGDQEAVAKATASVAGQLSGRSNLNDTTACGDIRSSLPMIGLCFLVQSSFML